MIYPVSCDSQPLNLFKPGHVVNQVGQLNAALVSLKPDASLEKGVHGDRHVPEDVFDPRSGFGLLPVVFLLLPGQDARSCSFFTDSGFHLFGGQVLRNGRSCVSAIGINNPVPPA